MNANEVIANRGNEIAGQEAAPPQRRHQHEPVLQRHLPHRDAHLRGNRYRGQALPRHRPADGHLQAAGGGERGHRQVRPHPSCRTRRPSSSPRRSAAGALPWRRTRRCWSWPCRSPEGAGAGRHRRRHRPERPQGLRREGGRGGLRRSPASTSSPPPTSSTP